MVRSAEARRRRRSVLLVGILVAGLLACSDDDTVTPGPTTTAAPTTTTTPRDGNGELTIGVLLPTSGPGTQIGGPMINGVRLAVDRINAAGGVFGRPVALVEADEGSGVSSAAAGFEQLIELEVDAIVGPSSNLAALGALSVPVSAGVLTCSPTATSRALDGFPDSGLFFRTAPSDTLQAVAIAQVAEQTGAPAISLFHLDDVYGRGLADAVEEAAAARNLRVAQRVGVSMGEADLVPLAVTLVSDEPSVVVVVGDADTGTRMLEALAITAPIWLPARILVNDALRAARSSQKIIDLPAAVRERVQGIAPLASPPDVEEFAGPFSAHAYDCVNLIALAAVQAGSDAPSRIAAQMPAVSVGGSVCRSFPSCADRIADGLQIDYHGASGEIALSSRGDPRRGRFDVFEFDEAGRDVSTGTIVDVATG